MVRAQEPKVFRPVVSGVSINVIDMNRDPTRMRIAFVPPAHAAFFAVGCDEVLLDVARRFVKTRFRAVNFAGKPSFDVLFILYGALAQVRTVNERVSADNIVAAGPFACNDFSQRYSHGSKDNGCECHLYDTVKNATRFVLRFTWSRRGDSNPGHFAYEANALPAELRRRAESRSPLRPTPLRPAKFPKGRRRVTGSWHPAPQ